MAQMSWMVGLPAAAAGVVLSAVAWRFAWFALPLSATGEAERLAAALGIGPAARVADVGAGTGAMAERMAGIVGREGAVYATELSAARRDDLAARKARRGLESMRVVAAWPDATGLPAACCDALYLRHVFHHIADRSAFVAALTRAVRPGGRIAIIDFPPGALWFHGADHGVTADDVRAAFWEVGWRERERQQSWGGSTFLVVFER
jgi:ubiquinone/menaquinone biosynthesis C-methylase UbiE